MRNKILITGSQGLIGQQLSKLFTTKGYAVVGLDNRLPSDNVNYGDILDSDVVSDRLPNIDGVIHLAAVSRVIWGERDPELCRQVNVDGTLTLLKAIARQVRKPWFIYASSREVYGQQSQLPVSEEADLFPCNVYAYSKQAAERLTFQYRDESINTAILRFSNVYGSVTDHTDRVLPAFCRRAVNNDDLYVEGKDNLFDFTHVTDIVHGIYLASKRMDLGEQLSTIHFVTGRGTTLHEAAEYAISIAKSKSRIIEKPSRDFDVGRFVGCPARAEEVLGWRARILPQQGIRMFVNELISQKQKSQGEIPDENSKSHSRLSAAV